MRKNKLKIALLISLALNLILLSIAAYGIVADRDLSPENVRIWIANQFSSAPNRPDFTNEPVVLFMDSNAVEISPVQNYSNQISDIPKAKLFMQPGFYRFKDKVYNCTAGGLYRFALPPQEVYNRIVYDNDMIGILRSIAWLHVHGNRDEALGFEAQKAKLLNDRLYLTCSDISAFTHHLLSEVGLKSRIVSTLTLDEWNSYNNGHTMLEVLVNDDWIVVDIDSGTLFTRNAEYLNLIQLIEAVPDDEYEIIWLNRAPNLDLSGTGEAGFNYSMLSEMRYLDEAQLRTWYRRVLQVPMIESKGKYLFFCPESQIDRVEQYSPAYVYMNRDEWIKTFYGKGKLLD